MSFTKITIAGGGTLGSQIAWQIAFKGFDVVVYDVFESGLEASEKFHKQFAELFLKDLNKSEESVQSALSRISYTTDLKIALENCDLLSESIPESPEIKKEFYKKVSGLAPDKTIFTTNSSTMLPSQFVEYTGRPEQFLALHFANEIWKRNVAEIMGHPGTSPIVFDRVIAFAKEIGMVAIPIHKEQNGYVMNTLLVPLLTAAAELFEKEVSDFESIDKTWMITMQVETGPFGIMDLIGLETIYHVLHMWGETLKNQQMLASAASIKAQFIDKGNLGVKTGKGFYSYPKPAYSLKDFLK